MTMPRAPHPLPRSIAQTATRAMPRSPDEDALQSMNRGELAPRDFFTTMAVLVADRAASYQPMQYPELAALVRDYAVRRSRGEGSRDPNLARQVGEWVAFTISIREQNRGEIETLIWSQARIAAAGMTGKLKPVEDAINRFRRGGMPGYFNLVIRGQEQDADERMRDARS